LAANHWESRGAAEQLQKISPSGRCHLVAPESHDRSQYSEFNAKPQREIRRPQRRMQLCSFHPTFAALRLCVCLCQLTSDF
jgi:hypothetical protein